MFILLAVPWGSNLDPCCKRVLLTGARKIHIKVVYVFLPIRHFPFSFLWLSLGIPTWILAAKVWSWQVRAKFTYKSFMFFNPSHISHFHSFGCPLGSQFRSLQQKCDPDRCAQKSYKVVYVFLPIRHFPFSFLWLSHGIPICILAAKAWSWQVRAKFTSKSFMFSYPSDIFHFHSFVCPLPSQLGSLRQECGPDRCAPNSHKSRLWFFTHQTFPIFIPLVVLRFPIWIFAAKAWSWQARAKFTLRSLCFLPIRHFPFSFLWLSLGFPI